MNKANTRWRFPATVVLSIVIALVLVACGGSSTNSGSSAAPTPTPTIALPSAPQAAPPSGVPYCGPLGVPGGAQQLDVFTSSFTVGGGNRSVVVYLTTCNANIAVGAADGSSSPGLTPIPSNFSYYAIPQGEVQAAVTTALGNSLTVFFTAKSIDRVFFVGSGPPVELQRQ
jgi:hypothetical protein